MLLPSLIVFFLILEIGANAAIIGVTVAVLALFVLVAFVVVRRRMKKRSDASSYIEVEIPEVKQDENCPDTKIETKATPAQIDSQKDSTLKVKSYGEVCQTEKFEEESSEKSDSHLHKETVTADLPTNVPSIPSKDDNNQGENLMTDLHIRTEPSEHSTHISLLKDDNLKETSKEAAGQFEKLEEEFSNLVDYVKENINKEKNVGTLGNNKEHNRYTDIGRMHLNFLLQKMFFQCRLMTTTSP